MASKATEYYDQTTVNYDALRASEGEHRLAVERVWQLLANNQIRSVLDVGCGTGLALQQLRQAEPSLRLYGVDPSQGLLDIAKRALPDASLSIGVGESLPFEDSSVDLVVATGIMHHVEHPSKVIDEMFRVATKAILISDHNNFAFGGARARRLRLFLYSLGLLGLATFIKQGFNRQGYSEEDGWWYPYSLLSNYADICRHADDVIFFPTRRPTGQMNLLLDQGHIGVVAIKRE